MNITTQSDEPRFPPELERIIFEMAACDRRQCLPTLMLVSRRVQAWLEPILYEAIIVYRTKWTFQTYPCINQHNHPINPHHMVHVRHLLYDLHESGLRSSHAEILRQCPNLESFAIWRHPPPEIIDDLLSMSFARSPLRIASPCGLTRLSAILSKIFTRGNIDFNHQLFQDITHLDVLDNEDDIGPWKEGNNFGCLNNLRFLGFYENGFYTEKLLEKCLEHCKALELLVVFENAHRRDDVIGIVDKLPKVRKKVNADGSTVEIPEDRVVLYNPGSWNELWLREVTSGEGWWAEAKRIARNQRRIVGTLKSRR